MEKHISEVAFPGLGIGEFDLCNVAFDLGDLLSIFGIKYSFPVYWYGIIITCGIIVAFLYVVFRGKYEGINFDNLVDVAICTVIPGIIGARLYFVLSKPEDFFTGSFVETISKIVDLRGGGLGIYGGIIGGIIGIVAITMIKKINTLKLLDMAAPGVMIAQAMGRWGNFMNGEAYGGLVEEGHPLSIFRMSLFSSNVATDKVLKEALGVDKITEMVNVHPTFLYESMWNLLGFVLINIFYKKKKFNGQIACMYLAWYGFGRFFIESLRTDSLYIVGTQIRISQVVGIGCFVIFGAALIAGFIYSKKKLYSEGAMLNGIDLYVKPTLELHPVFFEKKSDKNAENVTAEASDNKSEETPVEDLEDGTDN